MKRRVMSSILAAALMVGLSACGGKGSTDSTKADSGNKGGDSGSAVSMSFSWWGNQVRNERTQKAIDLYAEKNKVTIDGQFSEWADYWNKLATASAGHTLPDIVQMDYKYLEQYVGNSLLKDLDEFVTAGSLNTSDINEALLTSGKVNNKLYAIPAGKNAPSLLYNKTLLDKHGIKVKDNMSLEEFYAVCREVFEKSGYKTDVSYGAGDNFIEYVMRDQGAVLYEKGKLGATQAQLEKYFGVYEKGITEGWLCEPAIYAERTIGTPEQTPLVYGSSPATMSWCAFAYSNQLEAYQKAAAEGVELAMTTWPADNQKAANYLKPSQFFSVTVDSKQAESAVKFIDFLTNDIACNEILLGERGIPVASKVSDAIGSKLSAANQIAVKYLDEVVDKMSSPINPPAAEGASEVSKLSDQLVEKVCYKQISAADAAAELFLKGNEMMAKK